LNEPNLPASQATEAYIDATELRAKTCGAIPRRLDLFKPLPLFILPEFAKPVARIGAQAMAGCRN